jgi:outer membrane immunogenic protein
MSNIKFLNSFLLSGAALLLTVVGAQAADIVAPPEVYDWTGPYIGLQAGYAWANASNSYEDSDGGGFIHEANFDFDGFVGGGHAGYNLQTGNFVFGVEGDIEYADLQGDDNGKGGDVNAFDSDFMASIRGRLGYALDRALVYATGGVAFLDLDGKDKDLGINGVDYSFTGWTIGAGIDYALTDDLSIGAEYRFTDFGSETEGFTSAEGTYHEKLDLSEVHAVRGRISWHFH